MFDTILDALVLVFFGIALGYVGGKTRNPDNRHVGKLNALVMDFAVPASIFAAVVQVSRGKSPDQPSPAALLSGSMLVLLVLTYVLLRRVYGFTASEASPQALTTSLPNDASAELPLIAALPRSRQLGSVVVAIACGSIVTMAFVLTGIGRPAFAIRSFTLMGQVAGDAGLFLTGLIVSAQVLKPDANMTIQTLIPNVAHSLLVADLARLFEVAALPDREAIVLAAFPTGSFGILFGLRFGVPPDVPGTTLIASTALSAMTLSVAIYPTSGMGQP